MGKHRSPVQHPATYAKGLLAGAIAFVGAGATAAIDGGISQAEWWAMAAAGLVALGGVYGIPNRDPRVEAQDQSVQPPDVEGIYKPTKPLEEGQRGGGGGYWGGHAQSTDEAGYEDRHGD